jgi:cobalt-zinc-cadmium efflux system outer membrane protein
MYVLLLALALLTVGADALAQPASFTLTQAVEQARRTSLVRDSARAAAEGAQLAAGFAGRPLNPTIDIRAENLSRGAVVPDRDVFAVVTQTVETGGKRGARLRVAERDVDVLQTMVEAVERQVALDTVRVYMRAVRARENLDALGLQREGVGTLVDTMRRRVEEGFAAESDLMRFQTEAARLDTERSRLQIELNRALIDLATITGSLTPLSAAQLVVPEPIQPPQSGGAAFDAAVNRRPDVRLAAARVERAQSAAALERAKRFPDPAISGGYKRTQGQNTATAGIILAVPLFERNAQARATADAAVRATTLERDLVRARATAEARSAIDAAAALDASARRVAADMVAPAENVRDAARAMFREGVIDVLRLVDAERTYADVQREARSLAIDAFVTAIEARFALDQEEIP